MKGTKYICLSMLVCFILSGCCRKHEPDPEFVTGDEIVLKIDGAVKVKYVPETFQLGFSPERKQFRVHDDNMTRFYILTCSELPDHVGQQISCSLKYGINGKMSYKSGMSFEVEKWMRPELSGCGAKKEHRSLCTYSREVIAHLWNRCRIRIFAEI